MFMEDGFSYTKSVLVFTKTRLSGLILICDSLCFMYSQNYDSLRHTGMYKCLITNSAGRTSDEEAKSLELLLDGVW